MTAACCSPASRSFTPAQSVGFWQSPPTANQVRLITCTTPGLADSHPECLYPASFTEDQAPAKDLVCPGHKLLRQYGRLVGCRTLAPLLRILHPCRFLRCSPFVMEVSPWPKVLSAQDMSWLRPPKLPRAVVAPEGTPAMSGVLPAFLPAITCISTLVAQHTDAKLHKQTQGLQCLHKSPDLAVA